MEANKASRTALTIGIFRALHQVYDDAPKIFADPLAVALVADIEPAFFAELSNVHSAPMAMLMRSHFVLRSRFAEDQLARATALGVRQYVILGAGLDTFAFRQAPFCRDLGIFEVDYPATQEWKRNRIAAVGLPAPDNLRWAPVDFERQTLLEGLAAAGFDAERPTYFSWLGVTQYLTPPAIDRTLRVVAALAPLSSITLDFILPDDALTGLDLATVQFGGQRAAEDGEPFLTRFQAEELRTHLLSDLGFSDVFHLTPTEAAMRYFSGRQDGLRPGFYAATDRDGLSATQTMNGATDPSV